MGQSSAGPDVTGAWRGSLCCVHGLIRVQRDDGILAEGGGSGTPRGRERGGRSVRLELTIVKSKHGKALKTVCIFFFYIFFLLLLFFTR